MNKIWLLIFNKKANILNRGGSLRLELWKHCRNESENVAQCHMTIQAQMSSCVLRHSNLCIQCFQMASRAQYKKKLLTPEKSEKTIKRSTTAEIRNKQRHICMCAFF